MSSSTSFQNEIAERLREHFQEVEKEWRITKNATDEFSINADVYAPRLYVAVGPFNVEEGNKVNDLVRTFSNDAPSGLKNLVESNVLRKNVNPRCVLAIEVVYSGSTKHILGDITNASMMGLYGFVVASSYLFSKVERIFEYTKAIKRVGKAPEELFANVCIISDSEFLERL